MNIYKYIAVAVINLTVCAASAHSSKDVNFDSELVYEFVESIRSSSSYEDLMIDYNSAKAPTVDDLNVMLGFYEGGCFAPENNKDFFYYNSSLVVGKFKLPNGKKRIVMFTLNKGAKVTFSDAKKMVQAIQGALLGEGSSLFGINPIGGVSTASNSDAYVSDYIPNFDSGYSFFPGKRILVNARKNVDGTLVLAAQSYGTKDVDGTLVLERPNYNPPKAYCKYTPLQLHR